MAKQRGIILISTLLILTVMTMFVGATLALGNGWQASEVNLEERNAALNAADSGVHYARCRLRENPSWRGDGDGTVVSTPDLTVVEDQGNVIGLVHSPHGQVSQFRLRFNFYDGPN